MNKPNKNCNLIIFIFFLPFFAPLQVIYAQQYSDMKIVLMNGMTIIGEDGIVSDESVSLLVDNRTKTYNLNELQMVMVKKGLGTKYALLGGGGCAVLVLITVIGTANEEHADDESQSKLITGGLLWVVICAGVGYLIGESADDWNTIYVAPRQSSLFNNFKFSFDSMHKGELRIGLSYMF